MNQTLKKNKTDYSIHIKRIQAVKQKLSEGEILFIAKRGNEVNDEQIGCVLDRVLLRKRRRSFVPQHDGKERSEWEYLYTRSSLK